MEGFAVRPLTLRSIGGHEVLLDTTHDFLASVVELNRRHNWEPNRSHS